MRSRVDGRPRYLIRAFYTLLLEFPHFVMERATGSHFLVLVLLVDGAFGLLLILLPDLRSTFSGGSVHIRHLDG